ncbi:MAG: hypothetical protein ACRDZQ_00035 [Acidimicrobiales bacterium]
MRPGPLPSLPTGVLMSLARAGRPGLAMGARLDGLRSAGLAGGIRRWRASGDVEGRLERIHSQSYRRLWDHAVAAVGAELEDLGEGFLLLRRGRAETVVWRHLVMLDHPSTTSLALNKAVMHRLLVRGGLPVPEHLELHQGDRRPALAFLARRRGPCVVKPAGGTGGGAGVTCGVERADELWRAWLAAGRWGDRILVERRVPGEEYRLLLLDGELLDAVRRRPPCVRGDGRATVAQLIDGENRRRLEAGARDVARLIKVDLDCELALRSSGMSLGSVVPAGRVLAVKGAVSQNGLADNTTLRDLSPELVGQAVRAAGLAHLRLAGIDLVTPDPTTSITRAGGAILEVNGTPGLHYHYQVAEPDGATPVAVAILERLLAAGHSG